MGRTSGGAVIPGSNTVINTKTVANGAPYNAIVIQSFKDDQTAPLAQFPQLPYMYSAGWAASLGSPGPTDPTGATNYAFQFPGGINFWIEAPVNTNAGRIFLNSNGDGTAFQFPWVVGKSDALLAGSQSAGALMFPTDAAGLGSWLGAGTTPPFSTRLFLTALITGEFNLILRAIASQTGMLQANENSATTIVSGVGPDGGMIPGNNSSAVTASSPALYGGSGVPSNTLGANGSYYFRNDTPGTANQRIYIKSAGAWAALTI